MTTWNRVLLLLLVLAGAAPSLSGCAALSALVVPKEIQVPTPIPCIDPAERVRRPALWSTEQLLMLDDDRRTHAAWATLKRYEAYVPELEAQAEGCSRIPPVR